MKTVLTPEQMEAVRVSLIRARQDDNGNLSDGEFADSVLHAHFALSAEMTEGDVSSRLASISPIELLDRESLVKAAKSNDEIAMKVISCIPHILNSPSPNFRWGRVLFNAVYEVARLAKIEVLEELADKQGALVKEVTDLWMNTPHWQREPRPESLRYGYAERVCRDKVLVLKQDVGGR